MLLRRSSRLVLVVVGLALVSSGLLAQRAASTPTTYYPPRLDWARVSPAEAGFDPVKLKAAVDFAIENENPATKDLALDIPNTFRREAPYNALIGPTSPRAAANGLVIHRGRIVAGVGRYRSARHDLQRHQDLSFDGGWSRIRPRPDQRPQRSRRTLHAGERRSLRVREECADHLGPPPAADE